MKNNKGVTLVALIVIIILLIIFSSVAIYSSMKSYEMIELQKYKTQMQAIQNALDEFYEEYENFYKRNEDTFRNCEFASNETEYMEIYLAYITSGTEQSFKEYTEGKIYDEIIDEIQMEYAIYSINGEVANWWNNNAPNYGITIDEPQVQRQYFGVSTTELESLLGLKDIDISEYFIINFQKRYVFSVTSIEINTTKNENKAIYCLYELSEEEKIIEFEADNSGGKLEIEIIEKTLYYQIAKITLRGQETTIKQIYYNDESNADNLPKVESKKEFFEEITGLGTNEVLIKIKQNGSYKFVAEDTMEGTCSGEIVVYLHEPPVLENNMIPFKLSDELEPIICDVNDSEWYNYTSSLDDSQLAAVVLSTNSYNENIGKSIVGLFEGGEANLYYNNTEDEQDSNNNISEFVVKLWIPYNKMSEVQEKLIATSTDFINKTGIWLDAIWEGGKWKPVEHEHNWEGKTCQDGEGIASSKCKRCGLIEYNLVKHDESGDWYFEKPEDGENCCGYNVLKCAAANCEQIIEKVKILEHEWIEDSRTAATCTADGIINKHCNVCEKESSDILYATGHSYTSYTKTAPSLTGGRGYYTYECNNGCDTKKIEYGKQDLVLNKAYGSGMWTTINIKKENTLTVLDSSTVPFSLYSGTNTSGIAYTKINLDNVNEIYFKFQLVADIWLNLLADKPFNITRFGISNTIEEGKYSTFEVSEYKEVIGKTGEIKKETWANSIDVSSLSGNHYMKIYMEVESGELYAVSGYYEIRIIYEEETVEQ